MRENLRITGMPSKQIRRTGLRTPQTRYEQNVLNGAFIRCAASLPHGRPQPKHVWDARARLDSIPHPAHDAVLYTREAMRDAIESGDPSVIRDTRLAIESYFAQCGEAAVSVGAAVTEHADVAEVVREECDAVSAIVAASESQSSGLWDVARQKAMSAMDRLAAFTRDANQRARSSVVVR